jgi:hypothetical protein
MDRDDPRVPETSLVGREAERLDRRLRVIDPDDDRPGHAASLRQGAG